MSGSKSLAGRQRGNLNLPNILTALRIVLVPFFGWALLTTAATRSPGGWSRSRSSWAR